MKKSIFAAVATLFVMAIGAVIGLPWDTDPQPRLNSPASQWQCGAEHPADACTIDSLPIGASGYTTPWMAIPLNREGTRFVINPNGGVYDEQKGTAVLCVKRTGPKTVEINMPSAYRLSFDGASQPDPTYWSATVVPDCSAWR